MTGRLRPDLISTRLVRIAELARQSEEMVLTTLSHHIDVELLRESFRRTRKDGAPGVDGQTAKEYEAGLEENLEDLHERFKSGMYRAPAVRRVHIPKGDGRKTRPIGVPTFEDKVLQRAVLMVLEAVYEQDFLDCSYGFRPGRSAHGALKATWQGLMEMRGGFVLDVDIESFFDSLSHDHLRSFLDQRVRDGVLRRTINKWLKAGVLEEGSVRHPKTGTPQGGVVSPLLANVYLHEVLDKWFVREVQPRLRGRAFLVRYADDVIIVCAEEHDARRVMEVLPKRLDRYGLKLNAGKTRLVDFQWPSKRPGGGVPGGPVSQTFDFLGFTHFWDRSRKGRWVVKRRTAKDRFSRTLRAISTWCKRHRHLPVREQHRVLSQKLKGHDAYYGITGNSRALAILRHEVERRWRQWLNRRNRQNDMPWDKFRRLLARYPLPRARVVHSVYA